MPPTDKKQLPPQFVDAHHHFIDTTHNSFQQQFLATLVPNEIYLPEHYQKDVIDSLQGVVELVGSVHVECLPDCGFAEAQWVMQSLSSNRVKAIVASCDLTKPNAESELQKLTSLSLVRGIRWILDWDGPYQPGSVTHVATTRHIMNGVVDYLRDNTGSIAFEKGFALLSKYNLSFDLQCAPAQLLAAASLCANYPDIPVCIDHLGKPRIEHLSSSSTHHHDDDIIMKELHVWSQGMQAMAALPHVYVKISMLGYILPEWIERPEHIQLVRQIVRQVVTWFTPQRCMVALNWWKSPACSDSDGFSQVGPDPVQFLQLVNSFFDGYSEQDKQSLFCNTARTFYRF